jgi:hypothetical protein
MQAGGLDHSSAQAHPEKSPQKSANEMKNQLVVTGIRYRC